MIVRRASVGEERSIRPKARHISCAFFFSLSLFLKNAADGSDAQVTGRRLDGRQLRRRL
jgi:hypothetical protein